MVVVVSSSHSLQRQLRSLPWPLCAQTVQHIQAAVVVMIPASRVGSAPVLAAACAQTVQYIQPQHHERLAQAELLVIDEAAAIPLPLVKAMLGPYLVFLCSTVNG